MVIRKEHALTILKVRESGTFMPEEINHGSQVSLN